MSESVTTTTQQPPPGGVAPPTQPSGREAERQPAKINEDADANDRLAPGMKSVVDQLAQRQPEIRTQDPELADRIFKLSQRIQNAPEQSGTRAFQTSVAYALQDFEKMHGRLVDVQAPVRAVLETLAGTSPGLENDRAKDLLKQTAKIDSPDLVREIRAFTMYLGKQSQQSNPDTTSQVEALENRVRTAPRAPGPENVSPMQAPSSSPNLGETTRQTPPQQPTPQADTRAAQDAAQNGYRPPNGNQSQIAGTAQGSVLDTLLRAMRPDARRPPAPWDPEATPMVDRIAAVERHVQGEKNDKALQRAEVSGGAALQALQSFSNTEGAAVMGKIQAAASTAPGGIREVLSGMREGGPFADLRKQFSNALSDDAGFAAAYDKAASSLAAYGKNRTEAQAIIVQRPNADALAQRFEKLDAEIGAAASATPSKSEGRSMIDDIAKQAADLLRNAVNVVKLVFTRSSNPSAAASSSPAP